jgi:hypothetical protein
MRFAWLIKTKRNFVVPTVLRVDFKVLNNYVCNTYKNRFPNISLSWQLQILFTLLNF